MASVVVVPLGIYTFPEAHTSKVVKKGVESFTLLLAHMFDNKAATEFSGGKAFHVFR